MAEKKVKPKTELGKVHTTKSGNKIKIMAIEENGCLIGRYVEVVEEMKFLDGQAQRWKPNGQWAQFPGGIHDISWE